MATIAVTIADFSRMLLLNHAPPSNLHAVAYSIDEHFKREFADKEFDALKQRFNAQVGYKSKCIIMVRKEDRKGEEMLQNRIVASLDLYFQTSPDHGEVEKSYGFITNVCVAKSVRRKGIGSKMRHAISIAKDQGIEMVYLYVDRGNEGAVRLYEKVGFKKADFSSSHPLILMCFQFQD